MGVTLANNVVAVKVITHVAGIPAEFTALRAALDTVTQDLPAILTAVEDAEGFAGNAQQSAIDSEGHAQTSLTISQSIAELYPYIDYATADGDKGNRPVNSFIQVLIDETRSNRKTSYQVLAGPTLSFVSYLNGSSGFDDFDHLPSLSDVAQRRLARELDLIPTAERSFRLLPNKVEINGVVTPFSTVFGHSRASGATHINKKGKVVGTNFTTGSFVNDTDAGRNAFNLVSPGDTLTVTLDALAGNDQDWLNNSQVKLSNDANAPDHAILDVTAYVPSTQALSGTVVSAGGTGNPAELRVSHIGERWNYDLNRRTPLGLLCENLCTNYFVNSNDFTTGWTNVSGGTGSAPVITAGVGIAPDGNAAHRLQLSKGAGTTDSDYSLMIRSVAGVSNTNNTSIWVKSNTGAPQDLLIYNDQVNPISKSVFTVTNEWKRFTNVTVGNVSTVGMTIGGRGSATYGGDDSLDILVYQVQCESTHVPSSDIPTRALTSSRFADVTNMIGTNFSDIDAKDGGTLVIETYRKTRGATSTLVNLLRAGAGTVDSIGISALTNGGFTYAIKSNSVVESSGTVEGTLLTSTYVDRLALCFSEDSVRFAVNGILNAEDITAALPVDLDNLTIHTDNLTNGYSPRVVNYREISFYPGKSTLDQDLMALSEVSGE